MPYSDFVVAAGDSLPILSVTLTDANGVAADLSTASGVLFVARLPGLRTVVLSRAATIALGSGDDDDTVSITLSPTETSTTLGRGVFDARFVVTFAGGGIQTFPNEGSFIVKIT